MTTVPSQVPEPTASTDLRILFSRYSTCLIVSVGHLRFMAMQMPRMASWSFVIDDHADRAAAANVVNIVLRIIGI